MLFDLELAVLAVGERGEDAPLGAALEAVRLLDGRRLAQLDLGARVADARRRAQKYGKFKFFGEVEGRLYHFVGFFGRRRVEDRKVRVLRKVARVLLRLRRPRPRVVRDGDDHAAFDAYVGEAHQRVGGDVEADLLHRADRARARVSAASGDFECGLLVDGPLHVHAFAAFADESFYDFSRRSAGIAGGQPEPRGERAERYRLVSHTDLTDHENSPKR